jgi:hypothetical protein
MCGAARGEYIARSTTNPNVGDRPGAKTLKGSPCSPSYACIRGAEEGQAKADRDSETPVERRVTDAPRKRTRGVWAKSHQGFRERTLEGRNPREHPAVGVLNTRTVARDSRKG